MSPTLTTVSPAAATAATAVSGTIGVVKHLPSIDECHPWPAFDVPDDVRAVHRRLTAASVAPVAGLAWTERCRLADTFAITPAAALLAARDRAKSVRQTLAANASCPPRLRAHLANDPAVIKDGGLRVLTAPITAERVKTIASDETRDRALADLGVSDDSPSRALATLVSSGAFFTIMLAQEAEHPKLPDDAVGALVTAHETCSDELVARRLAVALCAHRACPSDFAAAQVAGELPRHIELTVLARLASGQPEASTVLEVAAALSADSHLSLGEIIAAAQGVTS